MTFVIVLDAKIETTMSKFNLFKVKDHYFVSQRIPHRKNFAPSAYCKQKNHIDLILILL